MLKILLCASEVTPIIKIGGLGDVVGSLPKSMEKLGVDVDIVVPYYPSAHVENLRVYKSRELIVSYGNQDYTIGVYATKIPQSGVDVYLLRSDEFFSEGGKDAFSNNLTETRIFSFFCRCVVELIKSRFNTYDVVHCNDWHTGLITHILEDELSQSRPATIMTIHNLSYQGVGDSNVVNEVGLDPTKHRSIAWDVADGDVNLLMQGIMSADFVTTVSPGYAKELLDSEDDSKITEVLKIRKDRFIGILNGIDYGNFPREYSMDNWRVQKESDKKSLLSQTGMGSDAAVIFSMISRLDPNQKGLDILLESVPEIVEKGGKFILLGSGNAKWEEKFRELENKYGKSRVSINTFFDPDLAVKIYKGSDFFLVPSKFEPCGLTQMISMWYGAIPVVHAVGGLKDTVKEGRTGFIFTEYSAEALKKSLVKCFNIYGSPIHTTMIETCLKEDFSFDRSAKAYKELYERRYKLERIAMGIFIFDPLTGEPTISATHRSRRHDQTGAVSSTGGTSSIAPAVCYFCKGSESITPPTLYQDADDWNVRVFQNKFPLVPDHEVIVHSPHHDKDMEDLSHDQNVAIIRAYLNRVSYYGTQDKEVIIFNNKGGRAGASIVHPHSQIIAAKGFPGVLEKEKEKALHYNNEKNSCYWCDELREAVEGKSRVVHESSHYVLFCPKASRWSYEMVLVPKNHKPNFGFIDEMEINDLAKVLPGALMTYKSCFGNPDRNFWFHTMRYEPYHWHVGFLPHIKVFGALEMGAGIWVSDKATPEDAGQELKTHFPSFGPYF